MGNYPWKLSQSIESCPKYLVYPEKIGIFEVDDEWAIEYHEGYNIDTIQASQLMSTATEETGKAVGARAEY